MREMAHHMIPIGNHGEETKSVTELNERDRDRERERERENLLQFFVKK